MGTKFTADLMNCVRAITKIKPEERDAKAGSLPEFRRLTERRKKTLDLIRPLIIERKRAQAEDPDYQKPDDLIQWVLDEGQKQFGEQSDEDLTVMQVSPFRNTHSRRLNTNLRGDEQLNLTFAAIHTTTIATTNAFYTIAVMPELAAELRDEIRTVLKEYGTFTSAALQRMRKLDSFLREAMRVYPMSLSTFTRKVTKPITLSNGQVIPAGVFIEVPSQSLMHDPDVIEDPQKFDAFRSYRARETARVGGVNKAGAAAANQLVTVSPTGLNWGYGRHACPGRFFAANEIKMIVGRALLDYDIRNADGETERYINHTYNGSVSCPFRDPSASSNLWLTLAQYLPDTTKYLEFKRIAV